jgi:glycosyltransferase involved in cell wall biosynthesis
MVSRLVPIKDHPTLINAVQSLRSTVGPSRVHVDIAGEGPTLSGLRELVAKADLKQDITFRGKLSKSEIDVLLFESDIYVHCTEGEGMSNSILEAMAAGLPVIASNVKGVANLVRHGVDGLLVAPHDPIGLADAIIKLLKAPERRQTMGRLGRSRALREFSVDGMAHGYRAIWRSLLPSRSEST